MHVSVLGESPVWVCTFLMSNAGWEKQRPFPKKVRSGKIDHGPVERAGFLLRCRTFIRENCRNLSFKSPSSKPLLSQTRSVFALPRRVQTMPARNIRWDVLKMICNLDCLVRPNLVNYHLSQNYYITARYFWTINFGRPNVKITSQELSWNYYWGAVILAGDLSDFCTVISGKLGLWAN